MSYAFRTVGRIVSVFRAGSLCTTRGRVLKRGWNPEVILPTVLRQLKHTQTAIPSKFMTIEEFDETTKQRFIEEDREAWNSICTILMGIISVGLVLACLAVYLVL